MLFFILFHAQALQFGTQDPMDPGYLSWPTSSWSVNPIQLTSNSAGSTADITFTFNPSTSLSSGVFFVNFPSGFPQTSAFVSNINLTAGVDSSLTVTSIQLPTLSGVYGPVSIMTRASVNGNIIDFNKIFTNIPISDTLTPIKANSLSVSFVDSDYAVVSSSQTLVFNFSLTEDLWTHDLIRIQLDSHFLLTSAECYSQVSFIKGVNGLNLACEYTAGDSFLYIYGLIGDVIVSEISSIGSLDVSIQVGTFTMPGQANPASDFEWNLAILRFGTNMLIEQYTGKGPSIVNGNITLQSWKPSNSLNVSDIVSGLTTFMDLTFTLTHTLPSTGTLVVRFSGIDILNTVWESDSSQSTTAGSTGYYFISPYIGGTCTLLTYQVTCQGFVQNVLPGQFTLTTLAHFEGSSGSLSYITTSTQSGILIDRFIDGYTIVYAIEINQQLFSYYSVRFASDNQGTYVSGTMGNVLVYICFQVPVAVPSSTSLTLYLPLSVTGVQDFYASLASTTLKAKLLSSATQVTGYSSLTASLVTLTAPQISAGMLTISLSALSSTITASNYIYIFLTSDSASTQPGLTLPNSGSNAATKYEVILNTTINNLVYKGAQVLTITPSSLGSSATLLCTSNNMLALPLKISFTPPLPYTLNSGVKLIVEVTFDSNIASDLGSGISGAYPVINSINGVVFSLVEDTVARLQMTGLTSVATQTYTFSFPIGAFNPNLNLDIRLFFLLNGRSDVEYEVMKDLITITGTAATSAFSSIVLNTVPSTGAAIGNPSVSQTFSIQLSPKVGSGIYKTGYVGVAVPSGYSLSNPSVFLALSSSTTASILYSFTSANPAFQLTSVFFGLSNSISVSSITSAITIQTLQAPGYTNTGNIFVVMTPSASATCVAYGTGSSMQIVSAVLATPVMTPNSVLALSPTSLLTNVTVTIRPAYNITGGIKFVLNTAWAINQLTSAGVSGLSGTVLISNTSNTFTIKGFNVITPTTSVVFYLNDVSPPSTVGVTGIFDSVTTYADSGLSVVIEQWTDTSHSACNVAAGGSASVSTISQISVFPNAAGAQGVYLYLEFSLPHSVPPTGLIYIASPVGSFGGIGDQSENCWLTIEYTTCTIYQGFLVITLAQYYSGGTNIVLLLDMAFDLPSTAGLTSSGFAFRTFFNGIIIDADSLVTFTPQQLLDVLPVGNGEIVLGQVPLLVDPMNEGELALYIFSFSISVQIEVTDSLLFSFPYEHDHRLGNSYEKFKWGDPGTNYLNCSSNALSTVICKVDHWNLIVTSFTKPLAANQLIDLNVSYIRNPAYTGLVFNDIGVYLYNSTNIKVVKNDYPGIVVSKAACSVRLRSVQSSQSKLQSLSNYNLTFFLDWTTLAPGDFLIVQFPPQYKIGMENSSPLQCSCSWSDQSPNSLNRAQQVWNTNSASCFLNDLNQVLWPILTNKLFSDTDLLQFTITGLRNPEWGYTRTVPLYEGDSSVFGSFDIWIQKIEVLTYSGEYSSYMSRTYFFEHSGFVGFYSGGLSAVVNGFDAMTGDGYITLVPGTQTADLAVVISSAFLMAKKLKFTPSNHPDNEVQLQFSSKMDGFTITREETFFNFRVSAPVSAPNSLNYIEWVLEEVFLDGAVNPAYIAPVKTLVEVYNEEILHFYTGKVNPVYFNVKSIPVEITTVNSPNSEIIIALGLVDSTLKGVNFTPAALLFTPDTNSLYFTITVSNLTFNGTVSTAISISFTLTGSDTASYSPMLPASFVVGTQPTFPSQISLLSFAYLSQTSLSLSIKLNQAALVYWVFGPSGLTFPDFNTLLNMTTALEAQYNSSFDSQVLSYFSRMNNTPSNGETWEGFQRRLYAKFLGMLWYDVSYVDAGVTTDVFSMDWLWANTSLTVYVWTDNKSGFYSNATYNQSTSAMNPPIRVFVNFSQSVDQAFEPVVKNALALAIGVLTDMFTDADMQSSQFSWVFNSDRASALAPSVLLSSIDTNVFEANLWYAGIVSGYTITSQVITQSSFVVPGWASQPEIMEIGNGFVMFNASVNGTGKICCVADVSGETGNSFQVFVGLNRNNSNVPGICLSVVNQTLYEVTIEGLEEGTKYSLDCITCSGFPVWPQCSSVIGVNFSSPSSVVIGPKSAFGWCLKMSGFWVLFVLLS